MDHYAPIPRLLTILQLLAIGRDCSPVLSEVIGVWTSGIFGIALMDEDIQKLKSCCLRQNLLSRA
jgi:hypothetical protein